MPKLAVQLVRRAPEGNPAIKITLSSDATPGLDSIGYVDPDHPSLEYQASIVAGALAEHQCQYYKDLHNPDQISKAAANMVEELKKMAHKVDKGKIKLEKKVGL